MAEPSPHRALVLLGYACGLYLALVGFLALLTELVDATLFFPIAILLDYVCAVSSSAAAGVLMIGFLAELADVKRLLFIQHWLVVAEPTRTASATSTRLLAFQERGQPWRALVV